MANRIILFILVITFGKIFYCRPLRDNWKWKHPHNATLSNLPDVDETKCSYTWRAVRALSHLWLYCNYICERSAIVMMRSFALKMIWFLNSTAFILIYNISIFFLFQATETAVGSSKVFKKKDRLIWTVLLNIWFK